VQAKLLDAHAVLNSGQAARWELPGKNAGVAVPGPPNDFHCFD
jgi:hypothetical protein